jgi:hypothetical protein
LEEEEASYPSSLPLPTASVSERTPSEESSERVVFVEVVVVVVVGVSMKAFRFRFFLFFEESTTTAAVTLVLEDFTNTTSPSLEESALIFIVSGGEV